MSQLVDDAIRALRQLPEEAQEAAARTILGYAAGHDDLPLADE